MAKLNLLNALRIKGSGGEILSLRTSAGRWDFGDGPEPPTGVYTLAIESGKVAENLSGFPLFFDLSRMPNGFWQAVDQYGFTLRAYQGGNRIPLDVPHFDKARKKGTVFLRADIPTTGTEVTIEIDAEGAYVEPSAPFGQHAVWADFATVALFGFDAFNRTGKGVSRSSGDPNWLVPTTLHTFTQDPHQGGTFDGTFFYIVDTNAIYKFDLDWNLVTSNMDPVGDTGISGANHCGDPCIRDGLLYVPMEYYATGTSSFQHISVFSATDLSFVRNHSLAARPQEVSSICFCPLDGLYYITDYTAGKVHKWTTDFAYVGEFIIQGNGSKFQGIEWWQERFWIVDDDMDEVVPVSITGETMRQPNTQTMNGIFGQAVTGNLEGIFVGPNGGLCVLADPSSQNSYISEYLPVEGALFAGMGWNSTGARAAEYLTQDMTVFTMSVSARQTSRQPTTNHCMISYEDWTSSGNPNDRITLSYGHLDTAVGLWDDLNGWLRTDPVVPMLIGETHRYSVRYNGTTGRQLLIDGEVVAADGPIVQHAAGMDRFRVFTEDATGNEYWLGEIGYAYIRSGILTDAWLLAEYKNLNEIDFVELRL